MKLFSEFVIIHEDLPMPPIKNFCPFIWEMNDFDSDGDYYWDIYKNMKWTELKLKTRLSDGLDSKLEVNVYRESNFASSKPEILDLERYINYKQQGRYFHNDNINTIKSPAITALIFETYNAEHYKGFLETVHSFLVYSQGSIVNYYEYDHQQFQDEFLLL